MLQKSILASIVLACFSYAAHAGQASDLANGIVPEDKKGAIFPKWQSEIASKVQNRIHDYTRTLSQLDGHFAPALRSPKKEVRKPARKKANAICTFLDRQAEKNRNKKMLIEGQTEKGIDTRATRAGMKNPIRYGVYAALVREGRQKEADAYALIRYFTYRSMFDAIPRVGVINPGQEPLIEKIIEKVITVAPPHNTQAWIDKKLPLIIDKANETFIDQATNSVISKIHDKYTVLEDTFITRQTIYITKDEVKEHSLSRAEIKYKIVEPALKGQGILWSMKSTSPIQYKPDIKAADFFPQSVLTFEGVIDPNDCPHVFFHNQLIKWKKKINYKTSPLVKDLGLDAALLSSDLTLDGLNKLLSKLKGFNQTSSLSNSLLQPKDSASKAEQIAMMYNQLCIKHFESQKDPQLQKRLQSVLHVLKTKQEKPQKHLEDQAKTISYKGLIAAEKYEQAAAHAFMKYIANVQLHYALTHNENGEEVSLYPLPSPEKSFIDKTTDLKDGFSIPADRADVLFQTKAYKWGQRVLELENKSFFIEKNALRAWMF